MPGGWSKADEAMSGPAEHQPLRAAMPMAQWLRHCSFYLAPPCPVE
jgi:hypothetical protein